MPRARKGAARRQAKVRLMKRARGFYGARSRSYRIAKPALIHAGVYAYRDRRARRREIRRLWIIRINAACRQHGVRYSQFMAGLRLASMRINRKMLSEIAIQDPVAFDAVFKIAVDALKKEAA